MDAAEPQNSNTYCTKLALVSTFVGLGFYYILDEKAGALGMFLSLTIGYLGSLRRGAEPEVVHANARVAAAGRAAHVAAPIQIITPTQEHPPCGGAQESVTRPSPAPTPNGNTPFHKASRSCDNRPPRLAG